jgi:outer membrane protein assembly factor BamB
VAGTEAREIAGYRIESEIGRGGMGVVYLATQAFPERRVALKVLSPALAADPAFRERFVRESNAAASTEHPHIVPIYGAGESDGELYLAMRYVEGTDLRSLLELEGPLAPERAAEICAEIAEALEAAHERGLIHRDVKPGNVLLDGRGHAYLTDFGLIRRTHVDTGITKTGQFMGTIDYVAPEQIMGGELDGRADVYSLGCVLYECLTGAPPFRRDSEVATIYAHLHDSPAPIDGAQGPSSPIEAVATRAMAKRPQDRFASAGEMAAALRGTSVASGGRSETPGLRGPVALAVGVLLVIVGVLAVVLSRGDGEEAPPASGETSAIVASRPGTLVGVDPESGEVSERFPTQLFEQGADPPRIDVGAGSIWIGGGDTAVTGIDLDTGQASTVTPYFVPNEDVLVVDRLVWTAAQPGIRAIDPATLETVDEIKVIERPPPTGGAIPFSEPANDLGAGPGVVWATFRDNTLAKVSTSSFDILAAEQLPATDNVAVAEGAVLVTDTLGGLVRVVDPRSLRVLDEIEVTGTIDKIASGVEGVWVLDPINGSVTEIDLDEGRAGRSWDVGTGARSLDLGSGWIWVARSDGTLLRVDPSTGEALAIQIGTPLVAVSAQPEPGEPIWVLTWASAT